MSNTEAISFWNFLKENTVEIPITQRDYAQGRLGKENLRKNFLADLKKALDNDKTDKTMKLDFVYGSTEKGNLNPLDGQQRLTTLWLLHWYIALLARELNEENCRRFKKFTYETRVSSREFCQNLCVPEYFKNFDGNDIVGFITKQTWFYSAWKQDPTIQSMLRMLGGTKISDKKGEDIVDGIEEIFQGANEDNFKSYWEKLSKDDVVVFYHLPLRDFGLSDDLYIKMNARGKQLTSFENFKADLIGYITKQSEDESLEESEQAKWKELLDPKNGIPIKLDTDWTDIFWDNRFDNRIDEIYFAFINRYFLQELICAKREDNKDLYTADNLEKENGSFRHLYGNKSDDSELQYIGLDKYLFIEDKTIPLSFFKSFRDSLNNFYKSAKSYNLNDYFPTWVDYKFEFIPKYDDAGNITTLGQKERVIFLAVCRYFEKDTFDKNSFKQWMRVVWNIVENSGIETISAMIGAMRLINKLAEYSHDIYNFLANSQTKITSDFAKEQIAEEIARANQFLNGAPRPDGKTWEEIIIEAENYAFFKGSVRFLFQNADGELKDWNNFDTKWKNVQEYFDKAGLMVDKYKNNCILIRMLISYFNTWESFKEPHYDNTELNWRNEILLNNKLSKPVNSLLSVLADDKMSFENYESKFQNERIRKIQNQLVRTDLLCNLLGDGYYIEDAQRLHIYYGYRCNDIYLGDSVHENKILASLIENNTIVCNQQVGASSFFRDLNINFSYKYNKKICYFQWWANPNETQCDVYLMEEEWVDYVKCPDYKEGKPDKENFYCFEVTSEMEENTTQFTEELKRLIEESPSKE